MYSTFLNFFCVFLFYKEINGCPSITIETPPYPMPAGGSNSPPINITIPIKIPLNKCESATNGSMKASYMFICQKNKPYLKLFDDTFNCNTNTFQLIDSSKTINIPVGGEFTSLKTKTYDCTSQEKCKILSIALYPAMKIDGKCQYNKNIYAQISTILSSCVAPESASGPVPMSGRIDCTPNAVTLSAYEGSGDCSGNSKAMTFNEGCIYNKAWLKIRECAFHSGSIEGSSGDSSPGSNKKKDNKERNIGIAIGLGGFCLISIILIIVYCSRKKKIIAKNYFKQDEKFIEENIQDNKEYNENNIINNNITNTNIVNKEIV